tara:strand:- start:296 stop:1063 length:768 start_codon:yes stop_codon:yes gene_type:complete
MSLTDKTLLSTYKDILQLDNSNNGVTSAGNLVKDGEGNNTMLTLGQRNTTIKPVAADHAQSFRVQNVSGDNIFTVASSINTVKVNETQTTANTQYLRFGYNDIDVDNGTHIGVPVMGAITNASVTFGTAADPVAPSVSNNGDDWIHYLHYVDTNITVDAVTVLVGATAASGDSINFHLCNIATGDSGTVDEWSGTTIVADQSSVTVNAGYEQFYRINLDIQSADVDAGNYLALTIEGNGTNSDYSVNALVRYHIR